MARGKRIEEGDQISALSMVKTAALATALLDIRESTQGLTTDFTNSLLTKQFPSSCPLI